MIKASSHFSYITIVMAAVFFVSLILHFHNAQLYNTDHGFDGVGHVEYVRYVLKYWKMPPTNLSWETHQSPLYYFLTAGIVSLFGNIKAAQYVNIFVLWLIIAVTGLGMWRVFKKTPQTIIGMLSLAALPMLNIFPPMVTNELLSTFWIISSIVSLVFFVTSTNRRQEMLSLAIFSIAFAAGYWTKISAVMLVPIAAIAFSLKFTGMYFSGNKKLTGQLTAILLSILAIALLCYPVWRRANVSKGPSNIGKFLNQQKSHPKTEFYVRLDWLPKLDMYNAQYYSLLGGGWNSFWTDGRNAITPFIAFHKKSLVLWSMGFLFLPLSLYGLKKIWRKNRQIALLLYSSAAVMFCFFVFYNYLSNVYSAANFHYEMGIVLPYSFGIAAAGNRRLKLPILGLLLLQFCVMVSFYWILPWWHVTKPLY